MVHLFNFLDEYAIHLWVWFSKDANSKSSQSWEDTRIKILHDEALDISDLPDEDHDSDDDADWGHCYTIEFWKS